MSGVTSSVEVARASRTLLRRQQVEALTGLARSTIFKLVASGEFPAPVKLTGRAVAWPSDAVAAWIDARVAGRMTTSA